MKIIVVYLALSFVLSCHQKVKENLNREASILQYDKLSENPLLMIPITSSIQPKDHTMSTLYGNKIAAVYARSNSDYQYPQGAVLYEVTWKQKPDEWWFGADIPKTIFSVEKITFQHKGDYNYETYKGKPLQKENSAENINASRALYIIAQKMAVSP